MNSVNLIPAARRAQRRARRAGRAWLGGGLAGGGILAVLGLGIHLAGASTSIGIEAELTAASQRQQDLTGQIALRQERLADLERRLAANRVMDQRPDWSRLVQTVRACAGDAIVVRSLAVEPIEGGTRPTRLAANRRFMVPIGGYALAQADVSRFALALERIDLFDVVSIESTGPAQVSGREAVSFELACWLTDGTAPTGATP